MRRYIIKQHIFTKKYIVIDKELSWNVAHVDDMHTAIVVANYCNKLNHNDEFMPDEMKDMAETMAES
jgi:hypothetical protein